MSGDAGAETVNRSRHVSRLYVVDTDGVDAGAAAETVVDALLGGTADDTFSLDGEGFELRFASRETQTPTMMEQMMRMIRAIIIYVGRW